MPRIDNPQRGEVAELLRNVKRLATASPLGNTSVTHGQTKFVGSHSLLIDGSGDVVGTLFIAGILNGNGNLVWSGPVSITGATAIGGALNITGPLTVNGTFAVNSAVAAMSSTALFVGTINSAGAAVLQSLQVNASTLLAGALTNTGMTTTGSAANVWVDPSTFRLYRFTSASRFKLRREPLDTPASLLDVPVETWVDRPAAERFADILDKIYHHTPLMRDEQVELEAPNSLRRIPGVVGEEVLAAGGDAFIGFNADGDIDSVDLLPFTLARTQVLNEVKADRSELDDLRRRVEELEALVARLAP